MKISDANPIQFWLAGTPTFNDEDNDGVVGQYFEQLLESADEFRIQFTDYDAPLVSYGLVGTDGKNNIVNALAFVSTLANIWEIFIADIGAFFTYPSVTFFYIVPLPVLIKPSSWADSAPSWAFMPTPFSSKTATKFIIGSTVGSHAYVARQAAAIPAGKKPSDIRATITIAGDGGGFDCHFTMVYTDNTGALIETSNTIIKNANGIYSVVFSFATLPSDASYLYIVADSDGSTVSLTIEIVPEDILFVTTEGFLAQSGAVSIKDPQETTRYIQYTNKKPFAGLNFDDDQVFSFRVKAKFFQQRIPTTTEAESITDGEVVKLSETLKVQKYLELEAAPFYIHQKMLLILAMNTVNIDGELFVMEEAYDPQLMDERYPFYLGKVWLTKQDSFKSNVYGALTVI